MLECTHLDNVGGHHIPYPIAHHPPRRSSRIKKLLLLLIATKNSIIEDEFRLNIMRERHFKEVQPTNEFKEAYPCPK
jgi:hypothetical protein